MQSMPLISHGPDRDRTLEVGLPFGMSRYVAFTLAEYLCANKHLWRFDFAFKRESVYSIYPQTWASEFPP